MTTCSYLLKAVGRFYESYQTSEIHFWNGSPCWEWLGVLDKDGYGKFFFDGKSFRAHRLAYTWQKASIPEGLVPDHLCRNPCCVNPAHLEPVTNRENILRGEGAPALNARKTHCANGHEFTPENTSLDKHGHRACLECRRGRGRAANEKAKAERNAAGGRGAPASRTHCANGHPYDEENTYLRKDGGRMCRACLREQKRARYAADPAIKDRIVAATRARREAQKSEKAA